jgi:phosphate transport system permease protein
MADLAQPVLPHRGRYAELLFQTALILCGCLVLALAVLILLNLFMGGLPALRTFGAQFLWSTEWNPVTDRYGSGVMVFGTLATGTLAIIVALPMSFGIAFFLTEVAPPALRKPVGVAIQLLAAVPSIIFGMWGFFVVVPLVARYIEVPLIAAFGTLPLLGVLFEGPPLGSGIFTAGLILALMILPFITAMFVEIIEAVPPVLKEAAYGVGATTTEVFARVSVPYGRMAMVGAVMLGLGRALGETMAVTFVIGNANRISASLFAPGATIASTIANEFPEAEAGSLKLQALLELGFLLFAISFLVLIAARLMVRSRLI